MGRSFWISTSWDDGHALDRRIAELLDRYQLRGTFYISRDYLDERLSDRQIVELSENHEIAAHTLTHPVLTQLDLEAARQEIVGSRDWLQDLIGKPVTGFAFPKGVLNPDLRNVAEEAGFTVARSVKQYSIAARGFDYLNLPTTVHIILSPFALSTIGAPGWGHPPSRTAYPAAPYPAGFPA